MLGLGLTLWPNRGPAGTGGGGDTGGGGGGGYRYWRVLVDNTQYGASYVSLAEISMYAPGSEVNLVTPSTAVTVSSNHASYPPSKVVDEFVGDFGWISQEGYLMGQWVTIDLGQARQVELVKIHPAGAGEYRPTRVVIQASNDELTGYVTLAEVNAPTWAPHGANTPPTTFGPLPA